MSTRQLTGTGGWICIVASLTAGLVIGAAGCAPDSTSTAEPEQVASIRRPPPPPEPAMRVASDAHLTLFGELPDHSRVPFQARAASPMKQHTFTTEGADFDVDVSPDGKWIVFSSTRHSAQPDLYLKTINGRAVTQLISDPAGDVQACFSPDGKRIAFASNRGGNWDLWMIGLEGGQATQITRSPLHEVHPSFAPDGQRLVYCIFNDRADQWELWTQQLDQPGSRRMIGVGLFPEWSPTSDSIVYQKARERGGRWFSCWRVDLVMSEPKFPVELATSSDTALIQPSWSPDGQWVTYGTARLGSAGQDLPDDAVIAQTRGDIWIMQADGSSPLKLTGGAGAHFGSVWSVDGRVYFTSQQNGIENIWSVKPLPSQTTQLPDAADDRTASLAPPPISATPPEANELEGTPE